MESEQRSLEQIEKVMDDIDQWFIRFGHIPNHVHNRILERICIEVDIPISDIEYYVDPEGRLINVLVSYSTLRLIWMNLTRKSYSKINQIMAIMEEVLSGYKIRVQLTRRRPNATTSIDQIDNNDNTTNDLNDQSISSSTSLPETSSVLSDSQEQENEPPKSNEAEQSNTQSVKEA